MDARLTVFTSQRIHVITRMPAPFAVRHLRQLLSTLPLMLSTQPTLLPRTPTCIPGVVVGKPMRLTPRSTARGTAGEARTHRHALTYSQGVTIAGQSDLILVRVECVG